MAQQELELPWRVGTRVTPVQGERFEPFITSFVVYPDEEQFQQIIWNIQNRRGGQRLIPELAGESTQDNQQLDFIRVVVDEAGRVHWRYRHQIKIENEIIHSLRHHGGRLGADSLDTPIHQAERILDRILGFQEEITERNEEDEQTIEQPALTFSAALIGLRATRVTVIVPGEQDLVFQYLKLVEDTIQGRTKPTTTPKLEVLNKRMESLQRILRRRKAPSLVLARDILEHYLTDRDSLDTIELLHSVGGNFTDRLKELAGITAGVARRQIAMRKLQMKQEDLMGEVYLKVVDFTHDWNTKGWSEDQIKASARDLSHSETVANLGHVVVQPYKARTERVMRLLHLDTAIESEDFLRLSMALQDAALELHAAERYTGRRKYGEVLI